MRETFACVLLVKRSILHVFLFPCWYSWVIHNRNEEHSKFCKFMSKLWAEQLESNICYEFWLPKEFQNATAFTFSFLCIMLVFISWFSVYYCQYCHLYLAFFFVWFVQGSWHAWYIPNQTNAMHHPLLTSLIQSLFDRRASVNFYFYHLSE